MNDAKLMELARMMEDAVNKVLSSMTDEQLIDGIKDESLQPQTITWMKEEIARRGLKVDFTGN